MKITQVKVYKFNGEGKTKAFASVTLDECLVLTGLKVIEGGNGLFVAMPQTKYKEEWKDIFFPVTKEFRQELVDAVLSEYNGESASGGNSGPSATGNSVGDSNSDEFPFILHDVILG